MPAQVGAPSEDVECDDPTAAKYKVGTKMQAATRPTPRSSVPGSTAGRSHASKAEAMPTHAAPPTAHESSKRKTTRFTGSTHSVKVVGLHYFCEVNAKPVTSIQTSDRSTTTSLTCSTGCMSV